MKHPSTFKDWRKIRSRAMFCLGEYVAFLFSRNRYESIPMTRELWRKLDEIRRIEKRMEVEMEAKDDTYYEALVEMITRKMD